MSNMRKISVSNLGSLPYDTEEAMNRLQVNFTLCGKQNKKVMITSSVPDEGKSFVSVHLWRLLAEAGNKVVLIDADIRRSVIRRRYQLTPEDGNSIGLAYYLSGQAELEDVIYATEIPGAFIIPTFHTVVNPTILIQSERFTEMLNRLSEVCDYVLIDTPPLSSVSDGNMIASRCDGALLVIQGGKTSRSLIHDSIRQIETSGCTLLGVVLNRTKDAQYRKYGKYSRYIYNYRYGYRYGYSNNYYGKDKK